MILIGADPELFAFKGDKPISVHNLLSGSKKEPQPVEEGAVQVDGTAAEFNIIPTDSEEVFVKRILMVRKNIEKIIQQKDNEVVLRSIPAVRFDKEYWDSIPSENKELGCDPDYNAYTGMENVIVPEEKRKGFETMRTGSGHIHIGWRDPKIPFANEEEKTAHFFDCRVITMMIDHLVLPFEKCWDTDMDRRKLYGNPGAFRPKPYGVEYRVLSNAWVDNTAVARILFRSITTLVSNLSKCRVEVKEKENGSLEIIDQYYNVGNSRIITYRGPIYDHYYTRGSYAKTPIGLIHNFFQNYNKKV